MSIETTERTKAVNVRKGFGIEDAKSDVYLAGFEHNPQLPIPDGDPNYVFDRRILRKVNNFLDNPRKDFLWMAGDAGAGKTSSILNIANRLNYPVVASNGSEDTMVSDFIGKTDLVNGTTIYSYGALAKAMKYGYIFLLNEMDRIPPGRLTVLHDVLDGLPLVLDDNGGEVIKPHKNFRFVATGNSTGNGDDTGLYSGVFALEMALNDRKRLIRVPYLDKEIEHKILRASEPDLEQSEGDDVVEKMVKLANMTRDRFLSGSDVDQPLSMPLTTRSLRKWAGLVVDYADTDNPLREGLEEAYTDSLKPEQRLAIHEIAEGIWGDAWGGNEL